MDLTVFWVAMELMVTATGTTIGAVMVLAPMHAVTPTTDPKSSPKLKFKTLLIG